MIELPQGRVELDAVERHVVEGLQTGFPLTPRPYAAAARTLGLSEGELIATLGRLLTRRVLTRFGPLIQVERLGGAFVLAALAVPEPRFDTVAAAVNALPEVAHNYRREHELNMWFVLATATPDGVARGIRRIALDTGLAVHAFPKLAEYYVGMRFAVGGAAPVGALPPLPTARYASGPPLPREGGGDNTLALIRACQAGLPLCGRPYARIASELGVGEDQVIAGLAALLASGAIRRIGAVPNHYALGYGANAMAVFDVADDDVDACGQRLARLAAVSHCYHRAAPAGWRYPLFAMFHGASRDAVHADVEQARAQLGAACRGHRLLFSTRILKKTGLRI